VGCINITGELNIGMMLRSASLLGAENFYIFGRKKFDARSTVGAENYINIKQIVFDDPIHADEHILAELRELNKTHSVILCEHGGYMLGGNDYKMAYEGRPSPLFIFGSESHGIPKLITDQVVNDGYPEYEFDRISIPQRGVLRSFNVSAAMAIVCWDYLKEMKL
jgi:tRNA G18 (ribose-2'-O)-methylase SpoU